MPAPKNTTLRFHIINKCLTSKGQKYWTTEEFISKIAEKDISINARTLRYDIDAMRFDQRLGYNAPIKYCKANKGYYYTDPNYSIDAINLSEEQLSSFDFVIDCLHEYQDLQVMQQFRGAIDKLAGLFSQFRNPRGTSAVEYEKAPYYKGLDLRDQLIDAIRNKSVITIHYTTFGRSYPIKHIIHPYLLKEYKNRWYLVGLMNSKKKPITLALDRMDLIAPATAEYLENTFFSTADYFKNFLGISFTEGEPEEIVLACNASLANYIKTQHLHESQEIIHEDKHGIHISLKLIPNYELITTILGYGKDMRVLKPQHLRDQVKQSLLETINQYEGVPETVN